MNIIIKIVLTLSIAYWAAFYVVDSKGFWLPIPFIALSYLWFGKFKRYEIKQNANNEYYIIDNITRRKKDLVSRYDYWWKNDYKSDCLTKDLELITKIYNRLIS